MNMIQPKTLPGFMELLPEDQILFNNMYDTIRSVYEKFGFLPLDTPTIEYSEILLAKAGGETEKQIYRFNKGDNDLSLRFDLTVPLARYVAEHYPYLTFPFKRYQMSKVFRGERPQKGRYREFYQCDIDIIGNNSLDLIYDAEIPAVIYEIFRKLDFGKFIIRINNRKVLNGFFKSLDLSENATDILRIIDKIDKIGSENVKAELLEIVNDEAKIDKVMNFISIKGTNKEIIESLRVLGISDEVFNEGIDELEYVVNNLKLYGVDEEYYTIDLTIARGLDYYTGTVYETNLRDYPKLGSICSGGRYDNLTEYYTKEHLPGIGISIGLTRLFSQLKEEGIISSKQKSLINALIIPMDNTYLKNAFDIASKLRDENIKIDICYDNRNMKHKMKYANKIGVPYIIIIGEDEVKQDKYVLKNMEDGNQELLSVYELINKLK
jgi:histidyl-tRNA synthetase